MCVLLSLVFVLWTATVVETATWQWALFGVAYPVSVYCGFSALRQASRNVRKFEEQQARTET